MAPTLLATLALGAAVLAFIVRRRIRSLNFIRGPSPTSWLLGFEWTLMNQQCGDNEYKWFAEYGTLFRSTACFSSPVIMVADPLGLQHILHVAGYRYPRAKDNQKAFLLMLGNGILAAEDDDHQRHRRALAPAFSHAQAKFYLPLFQRACERLSAQWDPQVQNGGKVINVYEWMSRMTLDIIGESAFHFHFGAMEGKSHNYTKLLEHMFDDTPSPTPSTIVYRATGRRFPRLFALYSDLLPTKEEKRFMNFRDESKGIARKLLDEKYEAGDLDKDAKDILSVLAQANDAQDPKKRLTEDEVLSQMATVILAGHDTSAASLVWTLWELAKHPEDQDRIRAEVAAARANTSGEFTPADYEGMAYLNAVIKEALRIHPISPNIFRYSDVDDVVPLSHPIVSSTGETLTQVPIPKGTRVVLSIGQYNRLESVWGKNPDQWNPSRFLDMKRDTELALGVYANILTFSSGAKSCIGWRFALLEMQAILVHLMENYDFSLAPGVNIMRVMAAIMIPLVDGKGPTLPLLVKPHAQKA